MCLRSAMYLLCLAALLPAPSSVAGTPVQITDGKIFDRLVSLVVDGTLVLGVTERTTAPGSGFDGDLALLRSTDGGASFQIPAPPAVAGDNLRHPSLMRRTSAWQLYFEEGPPLSATRIGRATSTDGIAFTRDALPLDLGWMDGGQRRPQVFARPDGVLVLSYDHACDAWIATSTDGITFDTLRTRTASAAAVARIAYRASDGRYFLVHETTGGPPRRIGLRSTQDLRDWSAPGVWITPADRDSSAPWPVVLADGELVVYYASITTGGTRPDLYSRSTRDGIALGDERQETSGNFSESFPFATAGTQAGRVDLVYSRSASPCGSSYCWLFRDADRPAGDDRLFGDGYEPVAPATAD
jgi:hypothetical protein